MESTITIRHFTTQDFPMINAWWIASGEPGPNEGMMPPQSSFIAEINGEPVLAVTVYFTNSQEIAYTENFIGNPEYKGPGRKDAAMVLSDHIANVARNVGYKRLICMSQKPVLVSRYQELGYHPTLSGVTTLVRSL